MRSPKYFGLLKRPNSPFIVRQVVGTSMVPTLLPGKIVVAYRTKHLRKGDIVVVEHQGLDKIKRIERLTDESVYIIGDNLAESTDSRTFGAVPRSSVLAKVIIRQ